MATVAQKSKKRKFVADGVFNAELNEFLNRELAEDGYAGVEIRVTPTQTEVIISATRTQNVVGEKGRRIRELTSLLQKRFDFPNDHVALYAQRVQNRALCAIAQAESVRYKLLEGLAVRRACYGVLRYIMENGAQGVEIIVSGKLRAQRAKAMKFKDGYMVKSGHAARIYIDQAVRHVHLKQGVLGIKVKIQLPHDPTGKDGVKTMLPDTYEIREPKADEPVPSPQGQPVHVPQQPQMIPQQVAAPQGMDQPPPQQQQQAYQPQSAAAPQQLDLTQQNIEFQQQMVQHQAISPMQQPIHSPPQMQAPPQDQYQQQGMMGDLPPQ